PPAQPGDPSAVRRRRSGASHRRCSSVISRHSTQDRGRTLMNTATATRYEIDIEDVEYIRHGSKGFLARIYKPRGTGPFPLVIDLHGGAWTKKDRLSDVATCEGLARAGIVAVALDFRMPPGDPAYPAMVQDVNYAIRWCKARAKELKT